MIDGNFDTFDGTLIIDDGSVVDVSCSDGEWELAGTLRFTTPFLQTGYPRLKGDTLRVTNGTISVEDLGTAATIHCDLILGPGSVLTVQDEAQFNVGGTNLTLAGGSIVSTNSTSIPELESNILVSAASTIDAVGAISFWGPHVDIQAPLTIHAGRFASSVFDPDLTIGPAGVLDFDYNDQLYVAQRMMGSVDLTGTTSGAVLMTGDRLELAGATTVDKHVIIESPLDITGLITIGASDTLTLRGGTPADPTIISSSGGIAGGSLASVVIEGAVQVGDSSGIHSPVQTSVAPGGELFLESTFGMGPIENEGQIAFGPADPPAHVIARNTFHQHSAGRLEIRVGPSGADHIEVTPNTPIDQAIADFAGELAVELVEGFVPAPGATYDIIVVDDGDFLPGFLFGYFDTITGPSNMTVLNFANTITITFTDPACSPADINADGALNLDDVNLFANAFIATDLLADIDDNGVLNLDDVNLFAAAFLAGCS
ncbi:MAG: GC-type dockerin domain-anchored protein [Phycisphaerales bacterium]